MHVAKLFTILTLFLSTVSTVSIAQPEDNLHRLKPPEMNLATLPGESSLDLPSLISELLRVCYARLLELDYISVGRGNMPRSFEPPPANVERPRFLNKNELSNEELREYIDYIEREHSEKLKALIHTMRVSYEILLRDSPARTNLVGGFRDLQRANHAEVAVALARLKSLIGSLWQVDVALVALKARAQFLLKNLEDQNLALLIPFAKLTEQLKTHPLKKRVAETRLAWSEARAAFFHLQPRRREKTLERWQRFNGPIDHQIFPMLANGFLENTAITFTQIWQSAEMIDRQVRGQLPTPASRTRAAVAQIMDDLRPSRHALYDRVFQLYAFARDLRILNLEKPDLFLPSAFSLDDPTTRHLKLAHFEHSMHLLVNELGFLLERPDGLAKLWIQNQGFESYVRGQLPRWNQMRLSAQRALMDLNTQIQSPREPNCEKWLNISQE